MSRHILSLSDEQLTAFDLDALIAHAELLNQHNRETFTTPFPKVPGRWLSHYAVKDICKALGIPRSTFYKYIRNYSRK